MTSYTRGRDPQNIVTRLYPLGYGEGINQLNIKGVNDGVPYIQSPKEITDKYGIIERVWIDRRYEDAASLKAAAEIMLSELQEPFVSYSVGFHELTASDYDKAAIGKRVRIIFPEVGDSVDTYITELTRKRDDLKESTITVANRETSIAASLADMADRQRIEQTYAQGATQIYSQALQANSAPDSGATMDFFLPSEMRIVNKVLVKVRIKKVPRILQGHGGGEEQDHHLEHERRGHPDELVGRQNHRDDHLGRRDVHLHHLRGEKDAHGDRGYSFRRKHLSDRGGHV